MNTHRDDNVDRGVVDNPEEGNTEPSVEDNVDSSTPVSDEENSVALETNYDQLQYQDSDEECNPDVHRTVTINELESLIDDLSTSVNIDDAVIQHLNENDLTYGKELGRGRRGVVHEVFFEVNGLKVKAAAKRIHDNTFSNISNVLTSLKLQMLVDIYNII